MSSHRNMGSGTGTAGPSVGGRVAARSSDHWRDHPLVRQQYFHVLPLDLLKEVEEQLDPNYCEQEPWRLERHLSKIASKQPNVVTFWDGHDALEHPFLLQYRHVEDQNDPDLKKVLKAIRSGSANGPAGQRTCLRPDTIASAYCGWLLTCQQFLQEHNALLGQMQEVFGNRNQEIQSPDPFDALASGRLTGSGSTLVQAYQVLCRRWRLDRLTAPYLPVPVSVTHMALAEPTPIHRQLPAGTFLHIPDIYGPLIGGQVEQFLASALADADNSHLAGWHQIQSPANKNKGEQVRRYMRLVPLQHVWKALRERHGQALRKKLGPIREVLALHFSMGASTVRWNLSGL